MTVALRPLRAADLPALDLQPSQSHMRAWLTQEFCTAVERAGNAQTALYDGRPVACAGLSDVPGRRYAWAFLGQMARAVMVAATKACDAMLSRETRPIWSHVRADIPANVRWLAILGFEATGSTERLWDGRDYELWVRTND